MKHEKKRFKELTCHPQYGLCVYVIMDKFVVLRSDDIDMEEFVEAFILYLKSGETTRQEERNQLDSKLLSDILHSMDSEWDKNIVSVLIGSTRSRQEITNLGIDSHSIAQLTNKIIFIVNERGNAILAANLRLEDKIKSVDNQIIQKQRMVRQKGLDWEKYQLDELEEDIDSLAERQKSLEDLKYPTSKSKKTLLDQMIRRTQKSLINQNRLGMRKKGSGRSLAMDSLDEQFVVNCIESKTTAHGRRQDQIMYTGRRMKKHDFL